jgi:hypothetical protein
MLGYYQEVLSRWQSHCITYEINTESLNEQTFYVHVLMEVTWQHANRSTVSKVAGNARDFRGCSVSVSYSMVLSWLQLPNPLSA